MRYDSLAPFYDRLMNHVDYDSWIALIERVAAKYMKKKKPSIFEIGGGTGALGRMLRESSYPYTGSDYCFAMAREANKKGLPVFCADARSLPVKKQFDLILFLYDGINYLLSAEDYERAFGEVARCLNRDGLFLFDITTETNSLEHFLEYLDFEDYGDYSFIRHSYYNEETMEQRNDFTIFKQYRKNSNIYEKLSEHHVQKVFPVKFIEEAIPRNLFKVEGIWDGFTFKRYSLRSERIHFLLRKTGHP